VTRLRRIAEEEYVLVVLLAGFGVVFLLVFPPFLLVNDSWLTLVAGREVVENGLPRHDELTVLGLGRPWTDQQWLAQVAIYGLHALGGHALLAVATCAVVVTAFGLAFAGARSLGAGPRAIWALFLPVLLAAPWAWTIRAQMLALPLYTGLLWLLAAEARRPSRRVWLAFPLLVVWANVHGSAALGALLVSLLGLHELVRSRGRPSPRSAALVVLAPLAVLATPYGPVATARYYHLMLVDPPFAGRVTEWQWASPAVDTLFFYVLIAIAIPVVFLGRRRLTLFDLGVLSLTLAGAVTAIRGIVWFALACLLLLPVAIGGRLEHQRPAPLRRHVNLALTTTLTVALLAVALASLLRSPSWYEQEWPREPVEAVRAEIRPGDRVYAADRFADWLLWKLPVLRGRVAYDVRFELYDEELFDRLQRYASQESADWLSITDGYRVVVVDETFSSSTDALLAASGARAAYRSDELAVVVRPPVAP